MIYVLYHNDERTELADADDAAREAANRAAHYVGGGVPIPVYTETRSALRHAFSVQLCESFSYETGEFTGERTAVTLTYDRKGYERTRTALEGWTA